MDGCDGSEVCRGERCVFLKNVFFILIHFAVVRAASSTRRSVKLGDKYFLPDWKTSKVGHDGKVSADELGFFNGVMAAPIIFLDAGADEPTPSECWTYILWMTLAHE